MSFTTFLVSKIAKTPQDAEYLKLRQQLIGKGRQELERIRQSKKETGNNVISCEDAELICYRIREYSKYLLQNERRSKKIAGTGHEGEIYDFALMGAYSFVRVEHERSTGTTDHSSRSGIIPFYLLGPANEKMFKAISLEKARQVFMEYYNGEWREIVGRYGISVEAPERKRF